MTTEHIALYNEISLLKSKLNQTDYKAIKFAEGELSAEEYEETRLQRKAWRERINTLEIELKQMEE